MPLAEPADLAHSQATKPGLHATPDITRCHDWSQWMLLIKNQASLSLSVLSLPDNYGRGLFGFNLYLPIQCFAIKICFLFTKKE